MNIILCTKRIGRCLKGEFVGRIRNKGDRFTSIEDFGKIEEEI